MKQPATQAPEWQTWPPGPHAVPSSTGLQPVVLTIGWQVSQVSPVSVASGRTNCPPISQPGLHVLLLQT
jgi:hypothetical protein